MKTTFCCLFFLRSLNYFLCWPNHYRKRSNKLVDTLVNKKCIHFRGTRWVLAAKMSLMQFYCHFNVVFLATLWQLTRVLAIKCMASAIWHKSRRFWHHSCKQKDFHILVIQYSTRTLPIACIAGVWAKLF
jgi:uncharacterized protein (DUF362 family)